jgi:hypothetical protein
MPKRDSQRSRLYAWEDRTIGKLDETRIGYAAAQGMVDAIWAEHALAFPPKVEKLPRQARAVLADASRLRLRLPESFPSWWLLHELAHCMTSTHDGESDQHGPLFVGVYLQLLTRYLRLPQAELLHSLHAAGIQVDPDARPLFLDDLDCSADKVLRHPPPSCRRQDG